MGQKGKFNIPDPGSVVTVSKYKLGDPGYNFNQIRAFVPRFAFDYLSMSGEALCFNSDSLSKEDYIGLLEGLKMVSSKTYSELKTVPTYRFHTINFDDPRVSLSRKDFKRILVPRDDLMRDEEMPQLYQLDFAYKGKARICGFLYLGVFYLVWYDKDHTLYPGK